MYRVESKTDVADSSLRTTIQRIHTLLESEALRENWPPAITNHPSTEALAMSHMPQLEPPWTRIRRNK